MIPFLLNRIVGDVFQLICIRSIYYVREDMYDAHEGRPQCFLLAQEIRRRRAYLESLSSLLLSESEPESE